MECVSVIVPVYNVEKYIVECVESIRNQTYENLEIILVDDGSPDRCPEICDNYAAMDDRIKVIHKDNGGLSSARNVGIKQASGEYITFVDSDDILHNFMIECMMSIIRIKNADMAVCLMTRDLRKSSMIIDTSKIKIEIFSGKEACEKMYESSFASLITACGKIYKKRLLDGIWFPEGKIHEDDFTSYRFFLQCNKIVYIQSAMYLYRSRRESITTSKFTERNFDRYDALDEQLQCYDRLNMDKAYKEVLSRYMYLLIQDWRKTNKIRLKRYIKKRYRKILKVSKRSNLFSKQELEWYCAPHNNKMLELIYWKGKALLNKINVSNKYKED